MEEAVKFALEIIRKREAAYETKSPKLRRDYNKSVSQDMKDLIYYAQCHKLDMVDIWNAAFAISSK